MLIFFWITVFIVSLTILIKCSDWLLDSSEKIGRRAGLSSFVVGVTIIGMGTSLPELVSSLVAVSEGATDVVAGNAIGSNIANMLLVIGFAALMGKGLGVTKNLIDLDLPLLTISTAIFFILTQDGVVTLPEALILIITYAVYLVFSFIYKEESEDEDDEEVEKINKKDIWFLVIGIIGLSLGARYLIQAVTSLAEIVDIAPGVIAVSAVAFGTSLPELLVSCRAALSGKAEVALGNVFGSNIFNILMVVGIPGLFATLELDSQTLVVGLPMLLIVTILFVISGISKKIHRQEGVLYLVLYIVFISKLFGWF